MSHYENLQDVLKEASLEFFENVANELRVEDAEEAMQVPGGYKVVVSDTGCDASDIELYLDGNDANADVHCTLSHYTTIGRVHSKHHGHDIDAPVVRLSFIDNNGRGANAELSLDDVYVERVANMVIQFVAGQTLPSQRAA